MRSVEIGNVSDILMERDFKWTIEDLSSLSNIEVQAYDSPSFSFAGATWMWRIDPFGCEYENTIGYIDLSLIRVSGGPPTRIDGCLILKLKNGEILREDRFSFGFTDKYDVDGTTKFLDRSEYLQKAIECGMPDVLTVIFTMEFVDVTEDEFYSENCQVCKCSYCKKECDAAAISFHEEKCLDKPIKCPECYDVVGLRGWYEHDCQKFKAEALEKLSDDFKELMINGNKRDTIIKVRGVEFPVHRDILIARSSYFSAMFKSNMKEKHTGVISINDCKPDIFRFFTHFIYTGKAGKLSSENVCDLYEIADKYQEDHLKKECLHFMMKSLSDDVFCDYIVLALKYDEKEMYAKAVEFFATKPREIASSAMWHSFVKEYPAQASELFIKTLDQQMKISSKNNRE